MEQVRIEDARNVAQSLKRCRIRENCDGCICNDHWVCKRNEIAADLLESQAAELERYRQWVNDLQSGMYINCVYCGHRYGPRKNTPVSMADVLKEHIEHCPEHPMSKLKAKNAELEAKLAEVTRQRDECKRKLYLLYCRSCIICGNFDPNRTCELDCNEDNGMHGWVAREVPSENVGGWRGVCAQNAEGEAK